MDWGDGSWGEVSNEKADMWYVRNFLPDYVGPGGHLWRYHFYDPERGYRAITGVEREWAAAADMVMNARRDHQNRLRFRK